MTSEVAVGYAADGHSGAGWYFWEADYPGEGSVGPYLTKGAAEDAARDWHSEAGVEVELVEGATVPMAGKGETG